MHGWRATAAAYAILLLLALFSQPASATPHSRMSARGGHGAAAVPGGRRAALGKGSVRIPTPERAAQLLAGAAAKDSDVKPITLDTLPQDPRRVKQVTESMSKAAKAGLVWAPDADLDWTPDQIRSATTPGAPPNPLQVVNCINAKYTPKDMDWARAMNDDPAALKIAGAWWSAKTRSVPVTLVTQSTVDRVPQLYSQCKSWRGPLAVVLYIGFEQEAGRAGWACGWLCVCVRACV